MDFPTLVIIIAVMLLVLKFLKASAKLLITATLIAAVAYFAVYILPTMI